MSLRAKKIPLKHLDNAENPIPSPISELCVCELFKLLNFCQIYSIQISMYYVQAYTYLGEKNTCMKLLYGLAKKLFAPDSGLQVFKLRLVGQALRLTNQNAQDRL